MIDVPVLVRDALKAGTYLINLKINVMKETNTEEVDFSFDNNNLVKESFKMDEKMCSEDVITFGLCEGTSIEFQYFGKPNITGRSIWVYMSCQYKDEDGDLDWYDIPLGRYDVEQCSRQASTGIIKAKAVNRLLSDYLDEKINEKLLNKFSNADQDISFRDIRDILLADYEVHEIELEKMVIDRDTVGVGVVRKLGSSALTFKSKWGIDTPFNYYVFDSIGATPTSVYAFVCASECSSDLNPNYTYRIDVPYGVETLEDYYFDFFLNEFMKAFDITEADAFNKLALAYNTSGSDYEKYGGWHQYFGIGLEKSDGTIEWYSKYSHMVQNSGVVGTLKDLSQKTIIGYSKIYFNIPFDITLSTSSSTIMVSTSKSWKFLTDHPWNNKYYTRSSLNTYDFVTLKKWTAPNGDSVDYDWTVDGWAELYKLKLNDADKTTIKLSELSEITLREATSAVYETVCQFGKLDRVTDLFAGVELNGSRLLPSENLYPSEDLLPTGCAEATDASMYSKLWADEGNVRKWRNLYITYKTTVTEDGSTKEAELVYTKAINADGTDDYVMDSNWLFKNLIWTESQIATYAQTMYEKMKNMTWFPFEMWCAGLPYIETGDELEINLGNRSYTSYVLQRNTSGIQDLHDDFTNGHLDIF